MSTIYDGFSPKAIAFFEGPAANNTKDWFEVHRSEYARYQLEPLKALVGDLSGTMPDMAPDLITIPAKGRHV
jgi:uncharacterized protein (DUF2461 family)